MVSEKVIKELIKSTKEEIYDVVYRNKSFTPKAYIIIDNKVEFMMLLPFSNDKEKVIMIEAIGKFTHEKGYKEAILVVDSYYRKANYDTISDIMENWEIEKPTTYPEKMRQSAIVLLIFNMDKKDALRGRFLPYNVIDGKVSFEEIENTEGLELGGVLYNSFASGYFKSVMKETLDFKKMSREYCQGKEVFDCIVDNLGPLVSRLIEDYPSFSNSKVMESLQKLLDPYGRIVEKEIFRKRLESDDEMSL